MHIYYFSDTRSNHSFLRLHEDSLYLLIAPNHPETNHPERRFSTSRSLPNAHNPDRFEEYSDIRKMEQMETREKIEKKVAIGTRDRSIYSNLPVTCEKEAVCPGRLDGSCSLYLNSTPQCSAVQEVEGMDTRKLSVVEKNFARSLASSYTILFHATKRGKVTTERNYHIRFLLLALPLENANLNYTGQTLPPSFSMYWSQHAFQRYFQREKGKGVMFPFFSIFRSRYDRS